MKIIVKQNYDEMSATAAKFVVDRIKRKPNAVLGLATGSTPIGLYKQLIKSNGEGKVSFKQVTTVNLDEYVGLEAADKQSYHYFMNDNLFDHIDIDKNNTNLPNGAAKDLTAECSRYTDLLARLRQDIQILGIGSDGHIGFNEPNTPFDSTTQIIELEESTIRDNARLFDSIDQVPRRAITMGISNIMNSRQIIMLASGANKAQAVYDMCKGEVNVRCPASVLQRHPDVIVILDLAAASKL